MNNKKINFINSKYIELKNSNSLQSQKELVKKQIKFKNDYSIENLMTKEDDDLLIFLFLNAGRQDSVGYQMESGLLKDAEYFGTFGQMQAPIMLNKNGKWTYQDPHKRQQIEVDHEEAINIANIVKSKIINISNIIEDVKNNKKDYTEIMKEFDSILQDILLRRTYTYFRKYIFNLYPDMMSSFINNNDKNNSTVQKIKNFLEINKSNHTFPLIAESVIYEHFKQCSVNDIFHVIAQFAENYNELELDNDKNDNKGKDMTKPPLNQILYGPPGTGKTYNTVVEAIKILKEDLYKDYEAEKISHEDLKTEFNELRKQGRIEFVTFHQSYSYEEFVEGIKPDIESWETSAENLKYKGANGIFKKICNDADSKFTTKDFDNIYNKFLEEISNTDGIFKLTTKKYKKTFGLKVNNNDNLNIYMGEELIKQGSLTKENIKAHFLNARKRFDWANYYDSVVEYLETKYNLKKENVGTQPYILIIDEINRGNISKIFGELITLIEDDKRENLSVKLPYSQEEFTVPKNLYIIGTMNTSDRSIASIDIALRRRFKFKEMMPEIDLVADFKCNFQECFKTLNERISILLDRDHQIGHSYFIKEKHKDSGTEDLKEIWFDSIIPLLNEYFYGDWDKLQAILGEAKADESSFIKKQTINKTTFAKEIDICETESFDFNLKCDFNSAMKNAFGDNFTIGETNAQ